MGDMDYYGYDGYPEFTHEHPQQSRKYRQSRKPRLSYMQSLEHHHRHRRSVGLTRSQAKKYRMSPEARFRRMLSAAGQKRRKNNYMRLLMATYYATSVGSINLQLQCPYGAPICQK